MAKCVKCGKKGLFLKLDNYGLCSACQLEKQRNEEREIILAQKRYEEEIRREKYIENQNKLKKETADKIFNIPKVAIELSKDKPKNRILSELEDIKFSNITKNGNYDKFIVIDIETTGLSASKDKIIELCATKFENFEAIETFETLIDPEKEIPKEVEDITHISNEMVLAKPKIKEVLNQFDNFILGYNIVGHNLKFDLKFIHHSGSKMIDTKRKYFCTYELSKKILKSPRVKWNKEFECYEKDYDSDYDVYDYKLETLCEYYNITIPNLHRAAIDAYLTGQLFKNLIEEKIL